MGLFAGIGGAFDRVFFILTITGDDLEPDEISRILGLKPTKSYRKGDETPSGSQYHRAGGWFLDSGEILLQDDQYEYSLFTEWLKSLPSDRNIWEQLQSRYEVVVRLIGYTCRMNADFKITSDVISELASRGLDLDVEPYLSLDEEE